MSVQRLVMAMAVAVLPFAAPAPVAAQTSPLGMGGSSTMLPTPPPRRGHTRIEIYPSPLLHRQCVDWYELQHRPSGTVLYPQMRCWWVRG
jgi:hypothetical protein